MDQGNKNQGKYEATKPKAYSIVFCRSKREGDRFLFECRSGEGGDP